MPSLLKQCYEEHTRGLTVSDIPSQDVQSYCLGSYIWQIPHIQRQVNVTESQINYIKSVYREYQRNLYSTRRHKRQAQRALRRELRVLSDAERQRFFDALNALKADGSYDAWANVHANMMVIQSGHRGPNFLGFHRVYLLFFEFALQRIDSSVSLCYWDSTMDNDMVEPQETAMFTAQLVGNGNGQVVNGPFADWELDGASLTRNIATARSSLMVKTALNRFFEGTEATSHRDVVVGFGVNLANTIEGQHNNVHNWVGGLMADAVTTAHDPVFILHHTFIDYIWERFREKIRQQGTDPTEYPSNNNVLHGANRPMDLYENFTNSDGYSDIFTRDFYQYEDMPSCATNCGNSRFLTCQGGVCVGLTASDIGEETSAQIMGASALFGRSAAADMEERPVVEPFQTSFVDPRTGNGNGNGGNMAAPLSRSPVGFSPFQSSMNDPRTGNGWNGIGQQSRGLPAGSLQGLQRFNGGVGPMRLNGSPIAARLRNPSGMGIRNAGGMSRTNGLITRFGNLVPPNNPIRHLWDQSLRRNAFQRSNLARSHLQPNSPLCADDIRRMVHLRDLPIQNTFTMDRVSDTRRWVYFPVRIVYMRPPGQFFGSRMVYNSQFVRTSDMYAPQIYPEFNNISPKIAPATYPNCLKNLGGSSKVFVQSNGFSYRGKYLDYAVLDERQPISESVAYVAVKNPDLGAAQSYLTAFDSCGRVCQPRCLIPGSNPPSYRPCSGVVNISNRLPRMYGRTYGEAVKSKWSFADKSCPSSFQGEIFMTFYCDYENVWPWKGCNGGTYRRNLNG